MAFTKQSRGMFVRFWLVIPGTQYETGCCMPCKHHEEQETQWCSAHIESRNRKNSVVALIGTRNGDTVVCRDQVRTRNRTRSRVGLALSQGIWEHSEVFMCTRACILISWSYLFPSMVLTSFSAHALCVYIPEACVSVCRSVCVCVCVCVYVCVYGYVQAHNRHFLWKIWCSGPFILPSWNFCNFFIFSAL